MAAGIYKITSPSNRIYVGSTKNITRRFRDYRNLKCQKQRKLYNSFIKHGVENHKFEVITECEEIDLLKLETQFGELYNVLDYKSGLNLQLPKDGDKLGGVSKEVINPGKFKKGIIPKNKGIPRTEEQKKHHSMIMMGRKSKRKGIVTNKPAWNRGIPLTDEVKKKLSESLKGRNAWNKGLKCREETKLKLSIANKNQEAVNKKIILDVNTGVFYMSIKEASILNNIKRTTLNAMLSGQNKNKTSLIYV